MEQSSSHARQDEPAAIRRPVRGPHGGWKQNELDTLKARIGEAERAGDSLRSVFDQLALELGRKPNSIRNFYYAQLRTQETGGMGRARPFETFAPGEVESLLRSVLISRAQGMRLGAQVKSTNSFLWAFVASLSCARTPLGNRRPVPLLELGDLHASDK